MAQECLVQVTLIGPQQMVVIFITYFKNLEERRIVLGLTEAGMALCPKQDLN